MKKIIFVLFTIALLFVSCDPKTDVRVFDPNAKILIRPAKGVRDANQLHLSAIEIVKQTTNLKVTSEGKVYGRGFSDEQRDYTTPALKMFSTDIINTDGTYASFFIESTDCVLQRVFRDDKGMETGVIDTIAYIPNATLRAAAVAIKTAYNAKNYEEVYRLFDQAFTFTPITGAEWRALKSEGKQ